MMKVLLGVCGGGYNERFLEKNFKRQLPNKVHAVLGVGVLHRLPSKLLPSK